MRRLTVLLEGCVTSASEAVAAARGGAGRLELCRELQTGGMTPSGALLDSVLEALDRTGHGRVPVFCMVRDDPDGFAPPAGGPGASAMAAAALLSRGAAGLVTGYLTEDGQVDGEALLAVLQAAEGMPVTFHRAFDHARDLYAALERAAALGVARILTGGGPGTAWAGRQVLRRLVEASRRLGGPVIMGGGGVRADHAAALIQETGLTELHARCEAFPALGHAVSRAP